MDRWRQWVEGQMERWK